MPDEDPSADPSEPCAAPIEPDAPVVTVWRVAWQRGNTAYEPDVVAREEPLEIRIANVPIAVVMRTPGHDEELVRGFLVTESIVPDGASIRRVAPCPDVDREDAEGNVVLVTLHDHVDVDLARVRRNLYASSSCGVCGKQSIERAMQTAPPLDSDGVYSHAQLCAFPVALGREQPLFDQTGGVHAAALFDAAGQVLVTREDVGRHNAVDKTIGWLQTQVGVTAQALVVSGRVSFEIVQKALAARIPFIVAVSAPTSLAVQLAKQAGITLVAFARDDSLRIYAGEQRVSG